MMRKEGEDVGRRVPCSRLYRHYGDGGRGGGRGYDGGARRVVHREQAAREGVQRVVEVVGGSRGWGGGVGR